MNLKSSEIFNKSSKIYKNNSSAKLVGSNEKKTFDNKITDVNLDIMRINKKLDKQSEYQEHIQSLMEEEIKLRQEVEKKTFLINQNLTSEMNQLKQNFISFTTKLENKLNDNIKKINDDKENNQSFLNSLQNTIIDKMKKFEQKISINKEEKLLKFEEMEEKIKKLEQSSTSLYDNFKTQNLSKSNELDNIKSLINDNNLQVNQELNSIKNEIFQLKNEIQLLKSAKNNICSDIGKIIKEVEFVNQRFEKTVSDINNSKIEIKTKLDNYEASNKLFEENFMNLKDEFMQYLTDIKNQNSTDLNDIKDNIFNQIKQMKNDIEKFNLNIIQENQKFIDFSQNQLQEHGDNMKKLFEYTSDDIDILKKKSDALENLIRNTRNEMINNINNVEGFLTNRYDSIFNSISSGKNTNNNVYEHKF